MSEETESLLKLTVNRAISETVVAPAEASAPSIEKLGSNSEGLWIRSYLLTPGKYNSRGWAVDRSTALQNIQSVFGKPLILYRDPISGKADHPKYNERYSAQANAQNQAQHAIGVVKRVYYNEDDDSYYADSLITDAKAKEYINSFHDKKLPIPVSPQIVYNPKLNLPNYYRNWELSHLAVVDKAAYGPSAAVIGTCDGPESHCAKELAKANTIAAAASASASAFAIPGYELQRDTSSVGAYLAHSMVWKPQTGKLPGRIA
jgi:uncharacterized protein DUF2213